MEIASVTEMKNRLSHYLRMVARGETVTVLDRGRPVAQLRPVSPVDNKFRELVAEGLLHPPADPLPKYFLTRLLPRPSESIVSTLIADREDRF